jgi:hypothetical protein
LTKVSLYSQISNLFFIFRLGGKIDFPGQSPLSSVNCSQIGEAIYTQRLRSVNSRVGSHKNSRKSASDQRKISAVNSIREKSLSSKN